jgi:guanosine-3',5'-bis(diphosphate) 3'-pyrophosphohydrolase
VNVVETLSSDEERARDFAARRHGSQRYGDHPYLVHLAAVHRVIVEGGYVSRHLLQAAWLHDVLEDTPTTAEELRAEFGEDVFRLVWAVTGVGANRKERMAAAYEKIRALLPYHGAAHLKLADRIANVESCVATGNASLLAMYRKEMPAFEKALLGLGDPKLWDRLRRALHESAAP